MEQLQRKAKLEEKKRKKKEQAKVAAELRKIAIQRRTEAQRLMSVLLADAAEAKYVHTLYLLDCILCCVLLHWLCGMYIRIRFLVLFVYNWGKLVSPC